jgi:hypothetical protein
VDLVTIGGGAFDGFFLAFDGTMALLAAALGFAAWRLAWRPADAAQPRRRTPLAVPEGREVMDVA